MSLFHLLGGAVRFQYRNYRGELGARHVVVMNVLHGSTEWHPEPQWLVYAFDLDRLEERYFALADIDVGTLERSSL